MSIGSSSKRRCCGRTRISSMQTVVSAREVADVFEKIAPLTSGIPGDQLGFIYGNPETRVTGVGCTWCVQSAGLQYCADRNLNMIITHAALWMPPQTSPWYDGPAEEDIIANRLRQTALRKSGMVVYRSHSNWDALPRDGVADSGVAALGLGGSREIARQKFFSVNMLDHEISVEDLRHRVEQGLAFSHCRVFGDARKKIRAFAFLIGGFGENQYHMPQAAMELGAEAIIIGEMSEFIVIACLEMGLPVIESLHSISENPGIRRQAEILAGHLDPLRVEYVASGAAAFPASHEPH